MVQTTVKRWHDIILLILTLQFDISLFVNIDGIYLATHYLKFQVLIHLRNDIYIKHVIIIRKKIYTFIYTNRPFKRTSYNQFHSLRFAAAAVR